MSNKISASSLTLEGIDVALNSSQNPKILIIGSLDNGIMVVDEKLVPFSVGNLVDALGQVIKMGLEVEFLPWSTVSLLIDNEIFTSIAHSGPLAMLIVLDAVNTLRFLGNNPSFPSLIVSNNVNLTVGSTSQELLGVKIQQ